MKHRFSTRFEPPAPVLPIRLRARAGEGWESHEALVDTGSDICGVPRPVVELLDLTPVRVARIAGALGQGETVVFRLDVEVEGRLFSKVEALAIDRPYALLGRNVQRKLWLGLDGPHARLDVR